MKNILVTGASGFIGSALVAKLESMGLLIVKLNSSDGDISVINFVEKYKRIKIDHVFHLASKTFIPESWKNPLDFYSVSVLGTLNILELCNVKKIPLTYVSAYLYGIPNKLPIKENHELKPNNPYAHSKFLAENLCKFYSEFYNTKVTIVRPFNVYGKGQNKKFLIPSIINQVLYKKDIKVKDLRPKRDYIYLKDFVNGLVLTLNNKKHFSIFNFGSGKELTVLEIIEIIQKIAGTNKKIYSEKSTRKNEIPHVVADLQKSKDILNWYPVFNFEDGIREILKKENK